MHFTNKTIPIHIKIHIVTIWHFQHSPEEFFSTQKEMCAFVMQY